MKKLSILLSVLILCFNLTACSSAENSSSVSTTEEIASEVVIQLDDTGNVNGYRTESGDNTSTDSMPAVIGGNQVSAGSTAAQTGEESDSNDYCGNKSSKVFHKNSCGSVSSMKEANRYFADRETLIDEGYKPCGKCNP